MSLRTVRKFIPWRKPSTKDEGNSLGTDWIGDAIKVANITIAAGDAIPGVGGFMKGAAGVFVALLEPVQQMGKNKENCKSLITSIAKIFETVNQELSMLPLLENESIDSYCKAWSDFETFLTETKERLEDLNSEGKLTRYFGAGKIQKMIADYQNKIQQFQITLLLANSVAMRVQITNITNILNRTSEDDPDSEEYYTVKKADIELTQKLASSNDSVEHYLARVYCGVSQRSAIVRKYKGRHWEEKITRMRDIVSKLSHPNVSQLIAVCKSKNLPALIFEGGLVPLQEGYSEYVSNTTDIAFLYHKCHTSNEVISELVKGYRYLRGSFAAARYLEGTIPLFGDNGPSDSGDYEGLCLMRTWDFYKSSQIQVRPYWSADNRLVLAIEEATMFQACFKSGNWYVYSLQEPLLANFDDLASLHRTSRKEKIRLLQAFHSLLEFVSPRKWHIWDNVPLGGVFVNVSLTTRPANYSYAGLLGDMSFVHATSHWFARFTEANNIYYSWKMESGIEIVEEYAPTQCINNGKSYTRICISGNFATLLEDFGGGFCCFVEKADLYSAFLSQINHIVTQLQGYRWAYIYNWCTFYLCDKIKWRFDLPSNLIQREGSPELFLFMQTPAIDNSGYAQEPHVYWSTSPSGTKPLTVLETYSLGIEPLRVTKETRITAYAYSAQQDILRTVYEACGLKADSDEVSQLMGYPLLDHKDFRPVIKRRHSYSGFRTTKRTISRKLRNLDLDPNIVGRDSLRFETAEMVPLSLKPYDLRTTGHELEYGDLDIGLIHAEMLRCSRWWNRPRVYDNDTDSRKPSSFPPHPPPSFIFQLTFHLLYAFHKLFASHIPTSIQSDIVLNFRRPIPSSASSTSSSPQVRCIRHRERCYLIAPRQPDPARDDA
ncbi:hypothetical protein M422DRAFT_775823 [Sphaerobolus stellatus SS14]|nr:hypothetical protein M422DRAFT_775823 [Sphaerobolus stellatus SS14]